MAAGGFFERALLNGAAVMVEARSTNQALNRFDLDWEVRLNKIKKRQHFCHDLWYNVVTLEDHDLVGLVDGVAVAGSR